MKKLKISVVIGIVALLTTTAVQAASLSVVGGNDGYLSGFDLTGTTNLSDGDKVKVFNNNNANVSNGLHLSGAPTDVTFTFLGSEAANKNHAIELQGVGQKIFNNKTSNIFDTETVTIDTDGMVPFSFSSTSKACVWFICWNVTDYANNGGDIDKGLTIGLFQESDTSVIALFGDGSGDLDFDDMAMRISVSAVPLPAALPLYGAGLAIMVFFGWRRKKRLAV
ncbi:MAG: hypothetical protein ABJN40_15380 [Sneathiella sp.]